MGITWCCLSSGSEQNYRYNPQLSGPAFLHLIVGSWNCSRQPVWYLETIVTEALWKLFFYLFLEEGEAFMSSAGMGFSSPLSFWREQPPCFTDQQFGIFIIIIPCCKGLVDKRSACYASVIRAAASCCLLQIRRGSTVVATKGKVVKCA